MTDSCAGSRSVDIPQPWLSSAVWDCIWIIGPALICSLTVLCLQSQFESSPKLPLWAWVTFVLCVDVAHVYATLFRTYLDNRAMQKNSTLLVTVPIVCWLAGALFYSLGPLLFWRVLAYLAVFHFIRQQYGFMALYSRKEPDKFKSFRWLDGFAIYMATLYPLLFWHTNLPRNFSWFVDGDFVQSLPSAVAHCGAIMYLIALIAYFGKELFLLRQTGIFNLPKNLLLLATALSWWSGIVVTNSDFAFTMTNVLSHGIPYMALVWLYERQSLPASRSMDLSRLDIIKGVALRSVPLFVISLILLAYLEEGLWDGFIWREHSAVFSMFWKLPAVGDAGLLAFLIPLLSLPQSTHYVLDGFIWRVKDRNSSWSV